MFGSTVLMDYMNIASFWTAAPALSRIGSYHKVVVEDKVFPINLDEPMQEALCRFLMLFAAGLVFC